MIREDIQWPNGYLCAYCGREFDDTSIIKTKDHIIPKSRGGVNDITNYVCSCSNCNLVKADLHISVFASIVYKLPSSHVLYKYADIINFNAWKIYNKYGRPYHNLYHKKDQF